MGKISRIVLWICSKFTRAEIEKIIHGLQDVLANRNPNVKPKDDFKEKHPNYRDFHADPLPPSKQPPPTPQTKPSLDFRKLLSDFQRAHGHPLSPVRRRSDNSVPHNIRCPVCNAPHTYLYFNDGKKRSQLRCKVCHSLSQLHPHHRHSKSHLFCPYCGYALYLWKSRKEVSIYKCPNDNCPAYLARLSKLNPVERFLRTALQSQFKLRYQYRQYHFDTSKLTPSSPSPTRFSLGKIYNSLNVVGLVLSFYITFGIPARRTARILRDVFSVKISYQTVLNYAEAAAYWLHQFNLAHKGDVDNLQVADEKYIKIAGKNGYAFFSISPNRRKISSYHIALDREALPATITLKEASRTAKPDQQLTFITDGNPSYVSAIHFLNEHQEPSCPPILHHQVIGLQNLDETSEIYRPLKQIMERFNRTYKSHISSFGVINGAVVLTVLFVTNYNFLRPHQALSFKIPIELPELDEIPTIQGRWVKILQMAASSAA